MKLRLKIFFWLTPVLLPVLVVSYLNYLFQKAVETERYLKFSTQIIENGAKELNTYLRLKNTTFNHILQALLRSPLDPRFITAQQATDINLLMAKNPGFAMILFTDKQAVIRYANIAADCNEVESQPGDVTGMNVLAAHRSELSEGYSHWRQTISALRQQLTEVEEQLDRYASVGENNSDRYRALQEQAILLQGAVAHPPTRVYSGGRELAVAADLPFRSDTYIFVTPSFDDQLEHSGYIMGVLDWSLVEERCYSFQADLKNRGLSGADMILFNAFETACFFNPNRSLPAEVIRTACMDTAEPVTYLGSAQSYLVSAPIVSAEFLTRMNDPGRQLSVSGVMKAARESGAGDAGCCLSALIPATDISLYARQLFKRSLSFALITVLVLVVMILLLSNWLVRPIGRVASLARRIADGDLQGRLDINRDDEIGELACSFNVMSEQLQQKQAALEEKNEELRISKERYRVLFDNAPIAIVLNDEQGQVKEVNRAALELTGYSREDIADIRVDEVYLNPVDREQVLQELFQQKIVRDTELELRHKDGAPLVCRFTRVLLTIDGKSMIYSMFEDITRQKKVEQDKKAMEEQLQRARKMEAIGLMAGGLAHDLNNILSIVVGYPEMILHDLPLDSELREQVEAIQEAGKRAALVVADLLTVARGAASTKEIHNLNTLVEQYLDSPECQNLKSLYPTITCRYSFETEKPFINCSPIHVRKCIMNLMTNAVESVADYGAVDISTRKVAVDEAAATDKGLQVGDYVVLSVSDNGPGIADRDVEHIYEPFYTRKVMGRSGTGLGLTIVWNTVRDHAGKIIVDSSDKGTCFQLYFPAGEEIPEDQTGGDRPEDLRGNGELLLVVDDEPHLRNLTCRILQSLGYRAEAVASGEQAIEFVKKQPVDLVVLDMLMDPGMSGCRAYEEILKLYPCQKAVVVSGFSENDDVRTALQLGAGRFIKKPFSKEQLGRAIRRTLHA